MLFRKKTQNNKKPLTSKIHFKQKTYKRKKRPSQKKNISIKTKPFKASKRSSNPRGEKVKKLRRKNTFFNILFSVLTICILAFTAYSLINFITSIRGGTSIDDVISEKIYVEGIESVPVYTGSEFVFKNRKDEEVVMRMLNQGLSVYKLPRGTKMTNVYEYYEERLPENGWEYLFTVPISTKEKLLGQYWTQGEKGLRIHVENNDVWYELITKNEAKNALTGRREAEIQRKRVLESSSQQSLLPDYPWKLSIPREYLTQYSSTNMGELQAVEIIEIGGGSKFLIHPIGRSGGGTYDQMLHDFVDYKTEETDEEWNIINTMQDFKKEREVLTARLSIDGEEGEGIVLMNHRNYIIYTIITNEPGDPFFEKIINEIEEP